MTTGALTDVRLDAAGGGGEGAASSRSSSSRKKQSRAQRERQGWTQANVEVPSEAHKRVIQRIAADMRAGRPLDLAGAAREVLGVEAVASAAAGFDEERRALLDRFVAMLNQAEPKHLSRIASRLEGIEAVVAPWPGRGYDLPGDGGGDTPCSQS